MKKMLVVLALAVLSLNSYGAVKCQPDGRGGTCCWDTEKEGIFKPVGC
jgi:hypothetical protein